MNHYFSVAGNQIPIELRPLYEEVSKTFERKVMDAVKTKKENKDEKNQKVFKKFNHLRGLPQKSRRTRVNGDQE